MLRLPLNDTTSEYFGLGVERLFKIFWINIQSGCCYDDVFLASFEIQITCFIQGPEITGAEPFVNRFAHLTRSGPVAGRYAWTTHDNLTSFVHLHFITRQRF